MTDFICPNCRGGFPDPALQDGNSWCPWCGQAINGEYEFEPVRSIARVERTDDSGSDGLLGGFLK